MVVRHQMAQLTPTINAFETAFGRLPSVLVRSPGRVNLLGAHLDYNDGCVLPVAIDREIWLAGHKRDDTMLSVVAADITESATFEPLSIPLEELPRWARYPAALVRTMGHPCVGANVVFSSSIPIGSGLSSSAALTAAFGLMWRTRGQWSMTQLELAKCCQQAEHLTGLDCGLLDPFTCLHGQSGHALHLDCRDNTYEHIKLPSRFRIVVADTRVKRKLASTQYNQRRNESDEALRRMKGQSWRDLPITQLARLEGTLRKRAEHILGEIDRVAAARAQPEQLGPLMTSSHISSRDLYEVSCPELDLMVDAAVNIPGCLGSRLCGGGFGGCTVNLVEAGYTEDFIAALAAVYEDRTGVEPALMRVKPSDGALAIRPGCS